MNTDPAPSGPRTTPSATPGRSRPATGTAQARWPVMRTRARLAVIAALLTALAGAPPSQAAPVTVSPGERVDYLGADVTLICTIGYVYTGPDRHTYAVTAGHCRGRTAGHAVAVRSGLRGEFLRTVVQPPNTGGPDYGLIDFGAGSRALPSIGDTSTTEGGHPEPERGQQVCRTGVSSGQQCGAVTGYLGQNQYLTYGMPASIPGDSGGPVWTRGADGSVQIVGIWLGEDTTNRGLDHGRFASLAAGLQLLS